MAITRWALKHPTTIFSLLILVLASGIQSYLNLPRESAPDIQIPYVVISTAYFGAAPSDMENLVTKEIEKELKNLNNVKEITSTSSEGLSVVAIEFYPEEEIESALQAVRDRVDLAKPDLPTDAEEPLVQEISFSDFPILIVNISGPIPLDRLKKLAEDVQDEVENIPGVLNVDLTGGLTREIHVLASPTKLVQYNVSLPDLVDTVKLENRNIPAGNIEIGGYKYLVRVPGEVKTPQEIGKFIVKTVKGKPIYVKDVAQVVDSFKERQSISRLDGHESVSLGITKRTGQNIIEVTDRVKELLDTYAEKFPQGVKATVVVDQSEDIRDMVSDLENNILSGLILVMGVLFLFLGFRNSFFVALAIPYSMLICFLVLSLIGVTLNMVVLFSLILALGMLVDNATVVVENIYRHLQLGSSRFDAAFDAVKEVFYPVLVSTITTLCAFLPLLFWPGIIGEFMSYLPLVLIITLCGSFLVAVIINPVLCASFMANPLNNKGKKPFLSDLLEEITAKYKVYLTYLLQRRRMSLLASIGALFFVILLFAVFNSGVEFFPETEPRALYINVNAPSGTKLENNDRIVREIEALSKDLPDVKQIVANVGSGGGRDMDFSGGGGGTPHKSRVIVDLVKKGERTQSSFTTLAMLRQKLRDITGAEIDIDKPEEGPPTQPPINIEVSGDDFTLLGQTAELIKRKIRQVEGLVNLRDNYNAGRPEILIYVDRDQVGLKGLQTEDVGLTLRTAIYGTEASTFKEGEDDYDIMVKLDEVFKGSLEDLDKIRIENEGVQYTLGQMAKIKTAGGLESVIRKNQTRTVTVSAEVEGRNANQALREVQTLLADEQFPPGIRLTYTGESKDQDEASEFLSGAFFLVIFLISIVLITQFDSVVIPFVIMFSVLLAMIGVLLGLIVTFTPFGIIMTGIGVISLAGIVVNNAIVMLDFIIQLRQRGKSKQEAIIEGGAIRLRPVLLTAVTTILGLIPLTTGLSFDFFNLSLIVGAESSQWWGPMGVAVIFGLAFATFTTLFMVPVIYDLLDDLSEWLRRHRPGHKPNNIKPKPAKDQTQPASA